MATGSEKRGRPSWEHLSEEPELATRQWEAARRTTAALHGKLHVEDLAHETLRLAAELTGATAGSLLLCVPGAERPVYAAVLGPWAAALVGQSAPVERGVVGSVLRDGVGRVSLDLGAAARGSRARLRPRAAAPRPTLLTVPLVAPGGEVVGAIQLLDRHDGVFDGEDLAVISVVAALAAAALAMARLSEALNADPAAREQQARLQQELAIGRRIQMSLLPPPRLAIPGFELVSRCEPATEVGGDFYDLFNVDRAEIGSECWGIVLGDVAGKGIPAALLMAVTTTLIRAQARATPSPAAALAAASAELYPRMRPPDGAAPFFATAVCSMLDTVRREILLASAGQTPPIYWPVGGKPRYVRLKGLPLGARPTAHYEETKVSLSPGDRLLFCSDGFVEARDGGGAMVGYAGLLDRLAAVGERRGPELLTALFDAETPAEDDRTAVLLTAAE
jgi:serine phosphatase RsbU (regulator of sigma subunit)